ncbi:MAG: hypothetical protein ACXQTS_05955 [Candidatus Methanospirareceae archaeon]
MDPLSAISVIVSIADEHSSSITAIATIALAIITYFYLREIRLERKFKLMEWHTDNLKKKVIEPWIRELEKISDVKKKYVSITTPRCKNIEVEGEILFNDLKNHANRELFQGYERFKKNCECLLKKSRDLEKKLEEYLKGKIRILPWDEFYYSENLQSEFFEKDFTLCFFLDSLLAGCKCTIEFNNKLKVINKGSKKLDKLLFYCEYEYSIEGKVSQYGAYIGEKITEDKRAEIKNILEKLLKEAKIKFKDDISEIYRLIEEINEDRRKVLEELKRLREYVILPGRCEYVRKPLKGVFVLLMNERYTKK